MVNNERKTEEERQFFGEGSCCVYFQWKQNGNQCSKWYSVAWMCIAYCTAHRSLTVRSNGNFQWKSFIMNERNECNYIHAHTRSHTTNICLCGSAQLCMEEYAEKEDVGSSIIKECYHFWSDELCFVLSFSFFFFFVFAFLLLFFYGWPHRIALYSNILRSSTGKFFECQTIKCCVGCYEFTYTERYVRKMPVLIGTNIIFEYFVFPQLS